MLHGAAIRSHASPGSRFPARRRSGDDDAVNDRVAPTEVELLDAGDGRRLDRFGRARRRPAGARGALAAAPARRGLGGGRPPLRARRGLAPPPSEGRGPIAIDGLTLELRPTEAGQVGLFPEHAAFWPWLRTALAGRDRAERPAPVRLHRSHDPRPGRGRARG